MKNVPKKSLIATQEHINRNFKHWFKKYSGMEGVHVGQKKVNGQLLKNSCSVVFHVNIKLQQPGKKIPSIIYVYDGNKRLKIPTDVIETGKTQLHGIKLGNTTQNQNSNFTGTISFYFTTSEGVYLGSNMHVLGHNLLKNGQIYYDVRNGDAPQTILLSDANISTTAQLIAAKFDGIDFGFAKIDTPDIPAIIEKTIQSVGPVGGILGLNYSNYHFVNLSFFGISSGHQKCQIVDLGAIRKTDLIPT